MFDFLNADEFWLDFTNLALGATTLVCLVAIVRVVLQEVAERRKVNAFVSRLTDDHVFADPALGITMADGGKRIDDEEPNVLRTISALRRNHADEDVDPPNIFRSEN